MSGYSSVLAEEGTAQREQQLALLGKDIFFDGDLHVSPARDFVLVEGVEAMRQSIYRRLLTKPGEYKARPNYGVGVQLYVKRRRTSSTLSELKARIIDQLSLDRRIDEVVAISIEHITDGVQVALKVRVAGRTLKFRPFDFTEQSVIGV